MERNISTDTKQMPHNTNKAYLKLLLWRMADMLLLLLMILVMMVVVVLLLLLVVLG